MNQSHQSHHSRTGLTSHLFYACDAFSYLYVSFFLCSESDDEESEKSDGGGYRSDFTFSTCFDVEIGSN